MASTPSPIIERPSRVRYGVLGFAGSLAMITYLDRVCFGTVAPLIQVEFGLSDTQKGMLFSAFALAYAAFEVPSGWLGDVFGPRTTLIRIVLWWYFFTALTGLVGMPMSGAAFGEGAVWMAGRFMGGMTPLVWALLIEFVGFSWRSAFWTFGVIGVLWCVAFARWFRNRPEEKAEVGAAELELIRAGRTDREAGHANVPWMKLLT